MRIEADAGGMDSVGFDQIDSEVNRAIAAFAGRLATAAEVAGDPGLDSAIRELSAAIRTADSSAALSLVSLSAAVRKAADHYTATDCNIARAAR